MAHTKRLLSSVPRVLRAGLLVLAGAAPVLAAPALLPMATQLPGPGLFAREMAARHPFSLDLSSTPAFPAAIRVASTVPLVVNQLAAPAIRSNEVACPEEGVDSQEQASVPIPPPAGEYVGGFEVEANSPEDEPARVPKAAPAKPVVAHVKKPVAAKAAPVAKAAPAKPIVAQVKKPVAARPARGARSASSARSRKADKPRGAGKIKAPIGFDYRVGESSGGARASALVRARARLTEAKRARPRAASSDDAPRPAQSRRAEHSWASEDYDPAKVE